MTYTFVDTSFYQALISDRDQHHVTASRIVQSVRETVVTTQWVLVELLNSCAKEPRLRAYAVALVDRISISTATEVVNVTSQQFDEGLRLYRTRMDKGWGLVDCISFQTMWERKITRVLTFDEHFEQAGFEQVR